MKQKKMRITPLPNAPSWWINYLFRRKHWRRRLREMAHRLIRMWQSEYPDNCIILNCLVSHRFICFFFSLLLFFALEFSFDVRVKATRQTRVIVRFMSIYAKDDQRLWKSISHQKKKNINEKKKEIKFQNIYNCESSLNCLVTMSVLQCLRFMWARDRLFFPWAFSLIFFFLFYSHNEDILLLFSRFEF